MAGISVCAAIAADSTSSLSTIVANNIVTGFCGIAQKAFGIGDIIFDGSFGLIVGLACIFMGIRWATQFLMLSMGALDTHQFVRINGPLFIYTIIGLAFAAMGPTLFRDKIVKDVILVPLLGLTTESSANASVSVAKSMGVDAYCPSVSASTSGVLPGATKTLITAEYLGRIRCIVTLTLLPMELTTRMWQGTPNTATLKNAAARLGKQDCSPLIAAVYDANGTILSGPTDADRAIYANCQAKADAAFSATQNGKALEGAQAEIEAKAASAHWLLGSSAGDLFKSLLFVAGMIVIFVIYGSLLVSSLFTQLGFVFQMAMIVFLSPLLIGALISPGFRPPAINLLKKLISQMVAVFFLMLSLNVSALLIGEGITQSAGTGMGSFSTPEGKVINFADAQYNGTTGVIKRIDVEQSSLGFSPTAYNMSFGSGFGNNGFLILAFYGAVSLVLIPLVLSFATGVLQYGETAFREGQQLFKTAMGPALATAGVTIGAAGWAATKVPKLMGGSAGMIGGGLLKLHGSSRAEDAAAAAGKSVVDEHKASGGGGSDGSGSGGGGGGDAPPRPPSLPGPGGDGGMTPTSARSDGAAAPTSAPSSLPASPSLSPSPGQSIDNRIASQAGMTAQQAKALSPAQMSSWASDAESGNDAMKRNFGSIQALRGDMPGAVKSWSAAAAGGDKAALTNLEAAGTSYLNAGRYDEAVPVFRAAADAGSPSAMNNFGAMTYSGLGTTKDEYEGKKWMSKAAEAGDPQAVANMGMATSKPGPGGSPPRAGSYFSALPRMASIAASKSTDAVVGLMTHSLSLAEIDGSKLSTSARATANGLEKITTFGAAKGSDVSREAEAYRKLMEENAKAKKAISDSEAFGVDLSGLQRTDL